MPHEGSAGVAGLVRVVGRSVQRSSRRIEAGESRASDKTGDSSFVEPAEEHG